jgi:hypothetical protein
VTIVIFLEVTAKHVVTPSLVVSSRVEPLKFLFINIPLTPPQIGVSLEIILISTTLHALKVFVMPLTNVVKTLVQLEFVVEIGTQLLSSVEHVGETIIKPIEKIIDQLVEVAKTVDYILSYYFKDEI